MDSTKSNTKNWWNKFVALVIVINLVLVFFNISYVPWRDTFLRYLPVVVKLYDPVKGIEPHPSTQRYLSTVDSLTQQLSEADLQAPPVTRLLAELRQQSVDLIEENPFLDADQAGTFAKLKRLIRRHLDVKSAKQALTQFWSSEYLAQVGWPEEQSFFDQRIRPLLRTNYYRAVDENGQFVDRFWYIDLCFIAFFGFDFLGRTFQLSRRQPDLSWWDAMVRRWYDGFLFLPVWRWLRVIPTIVRLHQSGWINLGRILAQATHEPAAYLADRVSMFLLVRLVNQTKDAVEQGELAQALLQQSGQYIRVSDVDKIDAITDRLLQLSIYKVLPQVQPDLKGLLHYSLKSALMQSDFYQGLAQVPGIQVMPIEATESLADYIARATCEVLADSYADAKGRELLDQLSQEFKQTFRRELQEAAIQKELQTLLADLLEELKLNYIQRSVQHDPEATLAEADQLQQQITEANP